MADIELKATRFALKERVRNSIASARIRNASALAPWGPAPDWVAATTYLAGAIVKAGGYLYMMFGNATTAGASGTSAASSPFNTNPFSSGQYQGLITDNTCRWIFWGVAEAVGSRPLMSTVIPAVASDVMDGYCAVVPISAFSALGLTQSLPLTTVQSQNDKLLHMTGGPFSWSSGNVPTILGPNGGTAVTPNYLNSDKRPVVEIVTNARWIAFRPQGPVYITASTLIEVNGRFLNINPFKATADASSSAILLDLSTFAGKKTVRIYGYQDVVASLMYGIVIGPTDAIYPPKNANRFSFALETDSIGRGGNTSPVFPGLSMEAELARRIGCDTFYSNGVGGTGFLNDNSGTKTTYIQRFDRIAQFNPDLLLILGNHNDAPTYTSPQRQAAILTYLQNARAALPNVPIFATGPMLLQSDSSTGTDIVAQDADMAAAIATFADPNTFYVPLYAMNGPWPYGTGIGNSPQANGNKDRYYYKVATGYTDTHPMPTFYPDVADLFANVINDWANS